YHLQVPHLGAAHHGAFRYQRTDLRQRGERDTGGLRGQHPLHRQMCARGGGQGHEQAAGPVMYAPGMKIGRQPAAQVPRMFPRGIVFRPDDLNGQVGAGHGITKELRIWQWNSRCRSRTPCGGLAVRGPMAQLCRTSPPMPTLSERLTARLGHEPTDGQRRAIDALARLLQTGKERATLVLKGYAGTGKTTLVGALVKLLTEERKPVVLLAPT